MNGNGQRICAWSGPVAMILFGIALYPLAHFLPPISPALDANATASIYAKDSVGIRVAGMVLLFSAALTAPFVAVISVQLKRIEGQFSPFTYTQLISGTVGEVLFIPPTINFCVASFRPERAADLVQLVSDQAWIFFVMIGAPGILQVLSIGFAILTDRHAKPIFPRWLGYLNLWAGVLFLPGMFVPFFLTGPFAWNGIIAFWIPASVFTLWFFVMFVMLMRAITEQEQAAAVA